MRQRRPRPSQQQPPLRDIPKRLPRSLLPSSIKQDSLIYTAVFLCRHATLVLLDNTKNGYVAHYDEERGTDLKWQEKRRQIGRRASLKEMSLKRHEMTWINNVISYAFHLVNVTFNFCTGEIMLYNSSWRFFCFFCECRGVCFSGLSAVERGKYLDGWPSGISFTSVDILTIFGFLLS